MAPRVGFEPTTLSLEVSCSIQLSYRGKTYIHSQFYALSQEMDRAGTYIARLRSTSSLSYRGKTYIHSQFYALSQEMDRADIYIARLRSTSTLSYRDKAHIQRNG